MNPESQNTDGYESPFTSHDCEYIFVDDPGDNTIRPPTGEHRKRVAAEWAKIQYWTAVQRGEIDPEKTPPPDYRKPEK